MNANNFTGCPAQKTTETPKETVASLRVENKDLRENVDALKDRIRWFEKQLFGSKSEKRLIDNPDQFNFDDLLGALSVQSKTPEEKTTVTYQRGKAKKVRPGDCQTDSGLRFNEDVPVVVVKITPKELSGPDADQYEVIDTKISYKLAQRPASYVVLQYELPTIKHKESKRIASTAMVPQVLDRSLADISLLVGMLIDKFCYHLPLYRQHQRMSDAGVTLSRATLMNLVKRAIALLEPIVAVQLKNVLMSRILAMDETSIKAGRNGPGKMKCAWFWPLFGDCNEIVFTYSNSRSRQHIEDILKESFKGTLLCDGYAAYARYVEETQGTILAQCWVHSRRHFVEAEAQEPETVACALEIIGQLYRVEDLIAKKKLKGDKKRDYRLEHSKPLVDLFFEWCQNQRGRADLLPKNPLLKAINYVLKREVNLRVFLEDPDLQLDTNHLERALRPIPMGRKNWLFCWTELGAEHVGIIQSLISTCKLHGINPTTYLIDVLQRVSIHPASDVAALTPRLWKEKFADNPMRSPLDLKCNNAVE